MKNKLLLALVIETLTKDMNDAAARIISSMHGNDTFPGEIVGQIHQYHQIVAVLKILLRE